VLALWLSAPVTARQKVWLGGRQMRISYIGGIMVNGNSIISPILTPTPLELLSMIEKMKTFLAFIDCL